ncbi:unnamed protein product [Clonostachys rosea]|uniref:F-box domain-containing protein n=1 Tax=Bionectria ochroleuca TaxID=29856 RepID=A0ABY6UUS8_BIOOC|nr:unnamed protein product [Clonostachys rosea]
MSLLDLPSEVLSAICEESCLYREELYSISLTCWRLFHISIPYLYRDNFFREDGSAITWAIEENRMATIQRALNSGVDVVLPHHLVLAIELGPDDLFATLWAHKAKYGGFPDLDKQVQSASLLHVATSHGTYDVVKTLLETGKFRLDESDYDKHTPLCIAARHGRHEMVKLFLEHGANAMTEDYGGFTPLSLAAGHNHLRRSRYHYIRTYDEGFLETARLLLQHGVEVEHRDREGRTALYHAAHEGDCQMVELLASYGANPTARVSSSGRTALHTSSLSIGRLDITELLVRLGADATAIDNKGQSALWMTKGAKEPAPVAKLLLDSGARMEADCDGETPLHSAGIVGSPKLVELLVEHGADVNAVNLLGATPYHVAVKHAAPSEVIKFLIEHGADANMTGKIGRHALLYAVRTATTDTIRVVLENMNGADLKFTMAQQDSILHEVIKRGSQEVIDLIIQFGGHKGFLAQDGKGRFHLGAITGDIALMQSVLNRGGSINDRDKLGRTALVVAILVGATVSIDWLLEKGASANARDKERCTPLLHATERKATVLVGTLLKYGARVGQGDIHGQTPLHIASKSGEIQIIRMLLEAGADIWDSDDTGRTPVSLASKFQRRSVLPLFAEKLGKSPRMRRRFEYWASR